MDSQSATVVMELTVWGNIKKDVGWKRPGRLLASFIVRSMQRSLCLSVCVFFLGGGCERQKMGRAAGMTSACRGGHGGETRRVKVGGGVGHGWERVCAPKFLVAVARQHHRTPPSKEDIRAEGQRMEEKQPETYSRRRERLAGCQMLRCREAQFHTPTRSLVWPLPTIEYLL